VVEYFQQQDPNKTCKNVTKRLRNTLVNNMRGETRSQSLFMFICKWRLELALGNTNYFTENFLKSYYVVEEF
jgi:hypothetical protein